MSRKERGQRAAAGASAAWAATLAHGGRVEVGLRRGRLVRLSVASLVFVAIGVLMSATAGSGSDRAVGVACLTFFLFCLAVFARQLTRTGARVIVDEGGVEVPGGRFRLPWPVVEGAFVATTSGTHSVQVVVDPEFYEQWFVGKSRLQGRLVRVSRGMLGGVRSFSLPTPLDVDEEAFARWLSSEAQTRAPR